MRKDLPPLNWLKTFEVAARLLNFSAAGRELNMTQSAVSQQIRLLEHYLGEPLFSRQHRKVALTNSGLAMLPVVQDAIERLQRGTADIFSPLGRGELILEVNTAFAVIWLAPRLKQFCNAYPNLSLQIVQANWESEFNREPADLAIMHGRGEWNGVSAHPLFEQRLVPFCARELQPTLASPSALLYQPLLEVIGNRQGWLEWLQAAGIEPGDSILRHKVDSMAIAIPMAKQGLGLFLSYRGFIPDQENLVIPFEQSVATDDNYFLVRPEDRPLSKSAALFCDWLLQQL